MVSTVFISHLPKSHGTVLTLYIFSRLQTQVTATRSPPSFPMDPVSVLPLLIYIHHVSPFACGWYILYVTERDKIASTVTYIFTEREHPSHSAARFGGIGKGILKVPLAGVQNSHEKDETQRHTVNIKRCFILSLDVQCFHFRGFLSSWCSNVSAHHTGDRLGFR